MLEARASHQPETPPSLSPIFSPLTRDMVRTQLVRAFFLYLPLCLPVHIVINHLAGTTWSWKLVLLKPEALFLLSLWLLGGRHSPWMASLASLLRRDGNLAWIVAWAVGYVAWAGAAAVVQGAFPDYWLQSLLMGWLLPMAIALSILGMGGRELLAAAWSGLGRGVAVLSALALVLYWLSFGMPTSFFELVFVNRTFKAYWGVPGGILFGELTLGNFNDIAIFFTGAIALVAGYLLRPERAPRSLRNHWWLFIVVLLAILYLCYSRGAFLSLGVVWCLLVISAAVQPAVRNLPLRTLLLTVGLFFPSLFVGEGSVKYWLHQVGFDEGSTSAARLDLWRSAPGFAAFRRRGSSGESDRDRWNLLSYQVPPGARDRAQRVVLAGGRRGTSEAREVAARSPEAVASDFAALQERTWQRLGSEDRQLAFGYGLGTFGILEGLTYGAGVHNLFLDSLTNAGIPGLLLFLAFWVCLMLRLSRRALRFLRAPLGEDSDPPSWSLLLAVVAVSVAALFASVQLDLLGTMVNSGILWLMIAAATETTLLGRRDA